MKNFINKKILIRIFIGTLIILLLGVSLFIFLVWFLETPRISSNDFVQAQTQPVQLTDKYQLIYEYQEGAEMKSKWLIEHEKGEKYVLPDFYSKYGSFEGLIRNAGWYVEKIGSDDYLFLITENPGSSLGYLYRIINLSEDIPIEIVNDIDSDVGGIFENDTEFITCKAPRATKEGNLELYAPSDDCETKLPQVKKYEVELQSELNRQLNNIKQNNP